MHSTHIRQRKLKRHFPYILIAVLVTLAISFLYFKWYDLTPIKTPITNTFEYLMEGNRRFVEGHPQHPDESLKHRQKMAKGQKPMAVVVACSDSRVSPELIFD
jgi:carbonic anhydrase